MNSARQSAPANDINAVHPLRDPFSAWKALGALQLEIFGPTSLPTRAKGNAMLTDRYGNRLTTTSAAARDAYVEGCDLILSQWDGGVAAFDRALAADPDFPLAHAGRARALQLASDMAGARAAIATAKAYSDVPERDASHVEVFNLMLNSPSDALAHVRRHVARWPTDALAAATGTNIAGLIGISGRVDRERDQLDFLAALAPHYGSDWWFNGHYGMALSELGLRDQARQRSGRRRKQS